MNDKPQKDPVDRLVDAYETMLERVHDAADQAEDKGVPWLRETLDNARDRAVELEELTREEADKISHYVERDIHDAAGFIADTGQEFRDWLRFDIQLIQDRVLDMMAGMADQTGAALKEIADRAREASRYHTGEITSPGTLECMACGASMHFKKTGHIPPCPKCSATDFRRQPHVGDDD